MHETTARCTGKAISAALRRLPPGTKAALLNGVTLDTRILRDIARAFGPSEFTISVCDGNPPEVRLSWNRGEIVLLSRHPESHIPTLPLQVSQGRFEPTPGPASSPLRSRGKQHKLRYRRKLAAHLAAKSEARRCSLHCLPEQEILRLEQEAEKKRAEAARWIATIREALRHRLKDPLVAIPHDLLKLYKAAIRSRHPWPRAHLELESRIVLPGYAGVCMHTDTCTGSFPDVCPGCAAQAAREANTALRNWHAFRRQSLCELLHLRRLAGLPDLAGLLRPRPHVRRSAARSQEEEKTPEVQHARVRGDESGQPR